MMRQVMVIVLVIVGILAPSVVSAQEPEPGQLTAAMIRLGYMDGPQQGQPLAQGDSCDVSAIIDQAITVLDGGDFDATIQARNILALANGVCLGLDFEGSTEKLTDPVFIPAGLYRVTVTTEGYFALKAVVTEGECGSLTGLVFNLSSGEADTGASTSFESADCVALWEISNVTRPYSVTFEKLN